MISLLIAFWVGLSFFGPPFALAWVYYKPRQLRYQIRGWIGNAAFVNFLAYIPVVTLLGFGWENDGTLPDNAAPVAMMVSTCFYWANVFGVLHLTSPGPKKS